MKRQVTRTNGNRWCRLEVELEAGRLSICGTEGRIVNAKSAKREALEYWVSFFEEQPAEIIEMNKRCGTRFYSPRAAAKYVVQVDGEFHGLDVDTQASNGRVFIVESCGQIRNSLKEWFPEAEPFLKWHLNDMHAECIHQEARGETYSTHPNAECPDCGYLLGSAWTTRALPPEVIVWAENLR